MSPYASVPFERELNRQGSFAARINTNAADGGSPAPRKRDFHAYGQHRTTGGYPRPAREDGIPGKLVKRDIPEIPHSTANDPKQT